MYWRDEKCAQNCGLKIRTDELKDLGADWKIILRWILNIRDLRV